MRCCGERAAIWDVDARSGAHRIFDSGLHDPNDTAWKPCSHALWTVVHDGTAYRRPVGVALDRHGALRVADDVGKLAWRVGAAP